MRTKDKFVTYLMGQKYLRGKSTCEVCARKADLDNPKRYPCTVNNKCGGGFFVKVRKPRPGKHERLLKALLKVFQIEDDKLDGKGLMHRGRRVHVFGKLNADLIKIKESMK